MTKKYKFLIYFLFIIFQQDIICKPPLSFAYQELNWDWNKIEPINYVDLQFPSNFIWGVSTSAHQIEGNCNCQWTEFEKNKNLDLSSIACDNWNRYKEDIGLIKNLGVNAYRFSIEWSKIEPVEGKFNQEAIDHYHDLINNLKSNDIMPVITLHHFTHPIWFENKSAFENVDNIKYFVRFAKEMFKQYSDKVLMWCTINEPGVYAFQGYLRGVFPPGKRNIQQVGIVSKNLIQAHIDVYKALKSMKNGDKCQIGIAHSITQYDPFHIGNKYNPLQKFEEFLAYYLNHIFYREMLNFFITGLFEYKVPAIIQLFLTGTLPNVLNAQIKYQYCPDNKKYKSTDILDFFGIQPYSSVLIDCTNTKAEKIPSIRPGNIVTDMPYKICAESVYRAIHEASFIGVPIYITETGIADSKDDRRELFIKRYLYAVNKAIKENYDVRGFFYWSLYDNFEWNFGYSMKFGLYNVNFKTQERNLRKGGETYKNIIKNQIASS